MKYLKSFLGYQFLGIYMLIMMTVLLMFHIRNFSTFEASRIYRLALGQMAVNLHDKGSDFYRLVPFVTRHLILSPWPYVYLLIILPVAAWSVLSCLFLKARTSILGTVIILSGFIALSICHAYAFTALW